MKRQLARTFVIAGGMLTAISVMHAQDGSSNGGSTQRRYVSDSRIPLSKEPLAPVRGSITRITVPGTNTVIAMPAPIRAFNIADYSNLSEAQLAYFMATRDSLLIAINQMAANKAVDPTVRTFAATQGQERVKHLEAVWHQIDRKGVGYQPIPNDYALDRLRQLAMQFDTTQSGPQFDANYMKVQYFEHQNQGQVLEVNRPNVHVEDFNDLVEESIKGFATVRDQSFAILTALGITLP
jgi:predicted outer membrane protein